MILTQNAYAAKEDFCATDPSVSNLEGQLQSLTEALADYTANTDKCGCGTCFGPSGAPTTEPPPTEPPVPTQPECVINEPACNVDGTFPEINFDIKLTDKDSRLYKETEFNLIKCMREVLSELPGEICISVETISENSENGVDVKYKLIPDDKQTHADIQNEIKEKEGSAGLCSSYKYATFSEFSVTIDKATFTVVSSQDPVSYRITLPMCYPSVPGDYSTGSVFFAQQAASIKSAIQAHFNGIPGTQEIELKEFLPSNTNGQSNLLALLVMTTKRFYNLLGFFQEFHEIMKNDVVGVCPTDEDFTITYYPIPRNKLRLADGPLPSIGRVEYYNPFISKWITICSNVGVYTSEWPSVFCKSKGFPGVLAVSKCTDANIPIGGSNVPTQKAHCNSEEFSRCVVRGLNRCLHDQDQAISCEPLVRLTGGQKINEGRVEFYDGHNWGTVCADSLADTAWAEVLCSELGFSGVDEVNYVTDTNVPPMKGDITFQNPDCNLETTSTMQDCGLRPDKVGCNHNKDVYVKCSGSKQTIPETLHEPIRGRVTCRMNTTIYADGTLIKQRDRFFTNSIYVEMPPSTQVIAVKCTKFNYGGILASFTNGLRSDRDWMCSDEDQDNDDWLLPSFNDSKWETPDEIANAHGLPFGKIQGFTDLRAKWIWSHYKEGGVKTLHCRLQKERPPQMRLIRGPIQSVGLPSKIGDPQQITYDYRVFSPNWPSTVCRDMGYPWAEGVTDVRNTNIDSSGLTASSYIPDYCPATLDGVSSECDEMSSRNVTGDPFVLNCRPRLELLGDSPGRGRLRVWGGYGNRQWETVCDYSPTEDKYNNVCTELGYTKVNRVMTLSSGSIQVTPTEPIGMHNPLCPTGATSFYECSDDPAYNQCSHDEDVYIICDGAKPAIPGSLEPITGQVSCGQGSIVTLYADGLDITSNQETTLSNKGIPKDTEVIGVHCIWPQQQNAGSLAGSFSNGVVTDDSWTCSVETVQHWSTIHFNPTTWNQGIDQGSAHNLYQHSRYIQPEFWNKKNQLYCRKQVSDYFRGTLAFERTHDPSTEKQYSAAFKSAAEIYEPLLTNLFTNIKGTQKISVIGLSDGASTSNSNPNAGQGSRKRRSLDWQLVTFIVSSAGNNEYLVIDSVLRSIINGLGKIGNMNIKKEHYSLLSVDSLYQMLRLVDGPRDSVGRVEVYRHGVWGNVALGKYALMRDFGQLFCRNRGYPYPFVIGMSTAVAAGLPKGTLINTIKNPTNCLYSPYKCVQDPWEPEVTHERDAAINCQPKLKLVGTKMRSSGRLEAYDAESRKWGSVCADDLFDWGFADVACHELGYGKPLEVDYATKSKMGYNILDADIIFRQNPACTLASASSFEECGINTESPSCTQDKNVYLHCEGPYQEVPDSLKAPIEGSVTCDSEVDVWADGKHYLHNKNWMALSYVELPRETEVVAIKCKALRYQGGILASFDNGIKSGDDWECMMAEEDTAEGLIKGETFSTKDFVSPKLAKSVRLGDSTEHEQWHRRPSKNWMWGREKQGFTSIICRTFFKKKPKIRLADGPLPSVGRVEINVDSTWGTFCDNSVPAYTRDWAELACKSLGYPGVHSSAYASNIPSIGAGTGVIGLKNPVCDIFTANSIFSCHNGGPCSHNEDIVLSCTPKVRLVFSDHPNNGTLQWFKNGQWGYVVDNGDIPQMGDYPLLSCQALGYAGVKSAKNAVRVYKRHPPNDKVSQQTPRCEPGATTIDDCHWDEDYRPAGISASVFLDCDQPNGVQLPFNTVDIFGSCSGTLRVWADSTLVYDSSVSFSSTDFEIPAEYKRLSVQCQTDDPSVNITLKVDQDFSEGFRCVHHELPPIWIHEQFDTSGWPMGIVTQNANGSFTISPSDVIQTPSLPFSCTYIKPGSALAPPFNITSPSGCEHIGYYLPDMERHCAYRECVYGINPWINLDGELSVSDVSVACLTNEAVPLSYKGGTTYPCETSTDTYCVACNSYPMFYRHPNSPCQFLRCIETTDMNPQGRNRRISEEDFCPVGRSVSPTYVSGIYGPPCHQKSQQCAPPPATTPLPTKQPCADVDADPTFDESDLLSGCTVLPSVMYIPAFSDAMSGAFSALSNNIEAAMDNVLCDLQAKIQYNVESMIANINGPGVIINWSMIVTKTPGFNITDIIDSIQQNIFTGELIYHEDEQVTRYQVTGGGCNIDMKTVRYKMTTNLKIPYINDYDDQDSTKSQELAIGYTQAISALYLNITGNHLVRIVDISPVDVQVNHETIQYTQIAVELVADSESHLLTMETRFQDAVDSLFIGDYEVAQSQTIVSTNT